MTVSNRIKSSFRRVLGGLLMAALFLGPTSRGKGAEPETTLDQSLNQAMDKNPEIIAAKAKVALAQAQLNSTRLEVARQLIALWNDRQAQENAVKLAQEHLKRVDQSHTSAIATADELDNAKGALIDAEAKASRTKAELGCLTGRVNLMAAADTVAAAIPTAKVQTPSGPIVDRIRQALDTKVSVNFVDAPIKDAIEFLQDDAKIPILLDTKAIPASDKESINLKLETTTLRAVLQAIEDRNMQEVRFVVRDYGILLTSGAFAEEAGYLPVSEFVRSNAGNNRPAASAPEVKAGPDHK